MPTITFYSDAKTLDKFKEISKMLEQSNKSQVFRDIINYFYERKEEFSIGLYNKIKGGG